MKTVAIFSIKGGTGRTSLTAHLGQALAQEHRKTILVDLDPQNALGYWFSMEPGERIGISRHGLEANDLVQYLRRSRSEVPYLPFGTTTGQEIHNLETELAEDPNWLRKRLDRLGVEQYELVLLDTAAGQNPLTRQALSIADIVLIVLQPDAGSYATIPAAEQAVAEYCQGRSNFHGAYYWLNQMDGRSELGRDAKAGIGNLLPESILPVSAPYDESLKESLALQQTLHHRYPDSQLVYSIRDVANWILQKIEPDHFKVG